MTHILLSPVGSEEYLIRISTIPAAMAAGYNHVYTVDNVAFYRAGSYPKVTRRQLQKIAARYIQFKSPFERMSSNED